MFLWYLWWVRKLFWSVEMHGRQGGPFIVHSSWNLVRTFLLWYFGLHREQFSSFVSQVSDFDPCFLGVSTCALTFKFLKSACVNCTYSELILILLLHWKDVAGHDTTFYFCDGFHIFVSLSQSSHRSSFGSYGCELMSNSQSFF